MATLSADSLIPRWRTLLSEGVHAQREFDADHPVRLLFGADVHGRPLFLSVSEAKPGLPSMRGAVDVSRGQRLTDGRWTLVLTLSDQRLREVFFDLCAQLVTVTSGPVSETQALRAMVEAIEGWKKIFLDGPSSELSVEEVRGIVAELWFGFSHLGIAHPTADIVHAWGGPLGAPKDFTFADGTLYEVKAVHPDSRSVKISSAEQLDDPENAMTLALVTLVPAPPEAQGAVSLRSLLESVGEELVNDPIATAELARRLDRRNVSADRGYASWAFVPAGLRAYKVSAEFPAIRRRTLNPTVLAVEYDISISGIQPHLVRDLSDPWKDAH